MAEILRIALIGAGYFAGFHLEAWQRLKGAELAAICDLDTGRLAEAKTHARAAAVYTDAIAMLDEIKPDLVDIATPPATHLQLVKETAARGVNTICQKPLAPSYTDAVAAVEAAEHSGIILAVHENIRFTPWHREIARLLKTEQLGRIFNITMRLRPGDGQGADAYLDRQPYFQQMDRFLIHETAIHWIDTFRFLLGEMTGVFACLRRLNPLIAGEDAGHILFAFANGAMGLFDGNRLNDHVSDNPRRTMGEMWIEGEHGVLRLDGQGRLWLKPHGGKETEHHYQWRDHGFAGDCVYTTQAHILKHFQEGTPLETEARAYLRNLDIEEAIYRSAAEQRWISLSQ